MAVQRSRREGRCLRTFRALLALYPGAFRDEYQRELVLVFAERYRDADGAWERARLSMEAAIGIFVEAPKEHGRMIRQDLHYALRMLRRHALVTTIIVLTLGVGIGANTAMFSLMNAVLLRTLPVPDADHLFMVNTGSRTAASPQSARLSGPMFQRLHDGAPNGVSVAAMSRGIARAYTRIDGEREATPASLQLVSSNFFEVVRISPVLGRTLSSSSNSPLSDTHAAIISHGYWSRRFGASPNVVGRTLAINGVAFTVTGVAPQQFAGVWLESPVDIWAPLEAQSDLKYSQDYSADGGDTQRPWLRQPQIWWLHVVVRAQPDQIASLRANFQASLADLTGRDITLTLDSFAHGFSGFRQQSSTPLLALVVMAVLLMLIASANVANLLLARAAARQREIATRMALGADRARLVHQMLTESVLLVALATVAAILFANWVGDALIRTVTATTDGPSPFAATLDLRVLGFTAATALGSVTIFGLVPAWRTTRLDIINGLGARGVVSNFAGKPARVIVILQVALSLVLVIGTSLMVRSVQNLLAVDLGFERSHLLSVGIDQRLADTSNVHHVHDRVLRAVTTVPGVEEAALAMCGLQSGCRARDRDIIIGGYIPRTDEDISFVVNAVTPGYFSTVGTRVLAGRAFTDRDHATAPTVAVVNMTLARKYFGGVEQALGRRFGQSAPDVAIVGIVEDARSLSVREPAVPAAFFPLVQRGSVVRSLEVRTKGSPEQAVMAVRRALAAAAPELQIERVDSMDERVRLGLARERLVLFLTSGFGTLALGLAAIGLFGVLSFSVSRRTSEFGVRMALGASRSQIRWGVVREAQWLVLCGVLLGVPVALLGGHLASALFFGVSPFDVPTLLMTALMLAGVALVCAVIPAMRASRVDPIVALRQD